MQRRCEQTVAQPRARSRRSWRERNIRRRPEGSLVEASEANDTTGQVLAVGVAVGYVERPLLRQVQPGTARQA